MPNTNDAQTPSPDFIFYREFPGLYGLPPADGGPDQHYRHTDNPQHLMIVQGSNPPPEVSVLNECSGQMVIEDNKEGWSEALLSVLRRNYTRPDPENPCESIIDFSIVRHRGDPIATNARNSQNAVEIREIINRLSMNLVTPLPDPQDADIPIIIDVPPTQE